MGLVIDHIGMSLHLGHKDDLTDTILHDVLIILRNVFLTHPQAAHLFHVRCPLGDVDDLQSRTINIAKFPLLNLIHRAK